MAVRGAPRRARRRLAPVVAVLAVLAACAVAPAAAQATLAIDHDQATPTVVGGGLMAPGKTFNLDETIHSSETQTLTGVNGTLTSTTPGVTVGQDTSAYDALTFGNPETNTTPFQATIGPNVACGTTLGFNLLVNTDQGPQDVPFPVPTGVPGPATSYDATDLPRPIPDGSNVTTNLPVN